MRFEPRPRAVESRSPAFEPRSQKFVAAPTTPNAGEVEDKAAAAAERARGEAIDALFSAARDLRAEAAAAERRALEKSAELIGRIVVEAAPAITLVSAIQAIQTLLEKRVGAADGGAIVVTSGGEMLAALRERLNAGPDRDLLRFEEDAFFGPARVVAKWRDGGVDCDLQQAADAVKRLIEEETDQLKGSVDERGS